MIGLNEVTKVRVNPEPIKNGTWKEFNKRGVLIAEGNFVNDKKHGLWREYYDHTGSVMIESVSDAARMEVPKFRNRTNNPSPNKP